MRGKPRRRNLKVLRHRIIPAHAGQTSVAGVRMPDLTDHPRACGANLVFVVDVHRNGGSSPRMRGKRLAPIALDADARIIPAHAGQTASPPAWTTPATDHPRACGANRTPTSTSSAPTGSSPRMRGKRLQTKPTLATNRIIPAHAGQTGSDEVVGVPGRIIPAHAGQTRERAAGGRHGPDHPRACGANSLKNLVDLVTNGSSPRMRGKRAPSRPADRHGWIIPAHAGQTCPEIYPEAHPADHPRACGANSFGQSCCMCNNGSSPRMRGKLCVQLRNIHRFRIIPAHAGQTIRPQSGTCRRADHPRACGANVTCGVHFASPSGSSPRMRGKRGRYRLVPFGGRIIPAHAGQTDHGVSGGDNETDHPRACGANPHGARLHTARFGSSPRMRGKRTRLGPHVRRIRIIPAHAGQTCAPASTTPSNADHPRACGANFDGAAELFEVAGSSPRMRGKRGWISPTRRSPRIIPAHAGQTRWWPVVSWTVPDHPRACGANRSGTSFAPVRIGSSPRMRGKRAHSVWAYRWSSNSDHPRACGANSIWPVSSTRPDGSSPRMRGKLFRCLSSLRSRRIIPAHAGQTTSNCAIWKTPADHPRACGANFLSLIFCCCTCGSSPRMRGKLEVDHVTAGVARIIPAHAGQTRQSRRSSRAIADHPRACGANTAILTLTAIACGSSPRMRGKLVHTVLKQVLDRIIPAHAGQTSRAQTRRSRSPDHPRACGANAPSSTMRC